MPTLSRTISMPVDIAGEGLLLIHRNIYLVLPLNKICFNYYFEKVLA